MKNLESYWYRPRLHPGLWPLLPFSAAFGCIAGLRRQLYRLGLKKSYRLPLPVIVVGNLTVGGTGKTPLVLWLVEYFRSQGKNPGIALRGVGGKKLKTPISVTAHSNPFEVGDEAVLLAQNAFCPVVACRDRVAAVKKLHELECDLVICDDGLQHYRLQRDLEIAVVDGQRYFGNHTLLPAGPLREPMKRLNTVDFIVINHAIKQRAPDSHHRLSQHPTFPMQLQLDTFLSIKPRTPALALSAFSQKKVHALAGVGNPQRFFDFLTNLDIEIIPHVFPDHHPYSVENLQFRDKLPILMTEKDAVKLRKLDLPNELKDRLFFLRVKAELGAGFERALLAKMRAAKA